MVDIPTKNAEQNKRASAPATSPSEYGDDFPWTIIPFSESRLVLRCQMENKILTYNVDNHNIYTQTGLRCEVPPPSSDLIQKYANEFYQLPKTTKKQMIKQNPPWLYDREKCGFYQDRHGIKVYKFGYHVDA
jgi:hypothetical protein